MLDLKVLIIDDEVMYSKEVAEFIKTLNYRVFVANHPVNGLKILEQQEIDLIILGIKMPEMNGITLLKKVRDLYPNIEVIMITGHGDMNSVIDALRLGALDFLNKPFGAFEIQSSIERCKRFIELSSNYKEVKEHYYAATNELKTKFGHEIIGESESIQQVLSLMSKVAQTNDTSVLITGESGTGKELVARGIHYLSERKENYFFDVNCSSIPETLFESEFFGHTRGSFTGAVKEKAGWFEVANKGTLFLDEIGDMPMSQQIKLLRVLEQRKIRRVGAIKDIDVDVRIIAASNQDLEKLVQENKFRMDLYHRLKSFTIHLEPLRDRKGDISILLEYFVSRLSKKLRKNVKSIGKKVYETLYNYSFPGNIRELKNIVERAIIISNANELKLKDFSLPQTEYSDVGEEFFHLDTIEKNTILRAMKRTKFKNEAAKLLGITPQALERRIKKHKIKDLQ